MYKTGRFAHMMGIGVDTLRYYEQLGLLSPRIDAQNGYRFYSDEDAFMLLNIKEYRGMGMPVGEIARLLRGGTVRQQIHYLEEKQRELDEQMIYLQKLRQRARQRVTEMNRIATLGQVQRVHCPAAYHLPYLELERFPKEKAASMMRRWTGSMPFIGFFISLDATALSEGRLAPVKPGLKAELKYVDEFKLPLGEPVRLMQGGDGISVSLAVRDLFHLTRAEIAPLLDYFAREGVAPCDDVMFIVEAMEYDAAGSPTHYVRAACPVKSREKMGESY